MNTIPLTKEIEEVLLKENSVYKKHQTNRAGYLLMMQFIVK